MVSRRTSGAWNRLSRQLGDDRMGFMPSVCKVTHHTLIHHTLVRRLVNPMHTGGGLTPTALAP